MKKILGLVIPSVLFLILIVTARVLLDSPRRISLDIPESVKEASIPEAQAKKSFVVGIAPQHSIATDHFEEFYEEMERQIQPELVVIISPNHWGDGFWPIMLPEGNTLSSLSLAQSEIEQLVAEHPDTGYDSTVFTAEHGIQIHLPYIQSQFSKASILPIVIDGTLSETSQEKLINNLEKISQQQSTLVVASIDFSHYLPQELAEIHDATVINKIDDETTFNFRDYDLDCPTCLTIAKQLAFSDQQQSFQILKTGNSEDYQQFASNPDETTSYITGHFSESAPTSNFYSDQTSFLFGGDVMLGRYVEELMEKSDYSYPVTDIWRVFRGFDHTHVNFEGPIPAEHQPTPYGSTQFSFTPETITTLKMLGVDSVSLANNHTYDLGADNYLRTKELLASSGIAPIGHPLNDQDHSTEILSVNGLDYGFVGLHVTNTYFDENAGVEEVKSLSEQGLPVFVTVHWGHEYQPLSHFTQQQLAHALIDAGADAIIGHHPHVVQEVEIYNNAPIFYSLGNLIFDQYFSIETEEGLLISLVDTEDAMYITLWPIESEMSKPKLMSTQKRKKWLESFAERHPQARQDQIKAGTLVIEK